MKDLMRWRSLGFLLVGLVALLALWLANRPKISLRWRSETWKGRAIEAEFQQSGSFTLVNVFAAKTLPRAWRRRITPGGYADDAHSEFDIFLKLPSQETNVCPLPDQCDALLVQMTPVGGKMPNRAIGTVELKPLAAGTVQLTAYIQFEKCEAGLSRPSWDLTIKDLRLTRVEDLSRGKLRPEFLGWLEEAPGDTKEVPDCP